jgi:hypothetical protein
MARDYQAPTGRPRWLLVAVVVALAGGTAITFLRPPEHLRQRLDAPEGIVAAQLWEVRHAGRHLEVRLRREARWVSVHVSDPLPGDLRHDLRERLVWNAAGSRLYLSLQGDFVWGYDLGSGNRPGAIPGDQLAAVAAADGVEPVPLP